MKPSRRSRVGDSCWEGAAGAVTKAAVVLDMVRDRADGRYAAHVLGDCDGADLETIGWYDTAAEVESEARDVYRVVDVLEVRDVG